MSQAENKFDKIRRSEREKREREIVADVPTLEERLGNVRPVDTDPSKRTLEERLNVRR